MFACANDAPADIAVVARPIAASTGIDIYLPTKIIILRKRFHHLCLHRKKLSGSGVCVGKFELTVVS